MSSLSTPTSGLPPRVLRQAATMLRAVSHPARLKIIELLMTREHTVGELAQALKLAQHLVSQHLKELRVVGVVSNKRDGRQKIYRLISPDAAAILRCIQKHYFTNVSFQGGEAI